MSEADVKKVCPYCQQKFLFIHVCDDGVEELYRDRCKGCGRILDGVADQCERCCNAEKLYRVPDKTKSKSAASFSIEDFLGENLDLDIIICVLLFIGGFVLQWAGAYYFQDRTYTGISNVIREIYKGLVIAWPVLFAPFFYYLIKLFVRIYTDETMASIIWGIMLRLQRLKAWAGGVVRAYLSI